jgi:NADPH:quinone reductase-like Zn-dependent oxidoreductase
LSRRVLFLGSRFSLASLLLRSGVDVIVDFIGATYFQGNLDVAARDSRIVLLGLMGFPLVLQIPTAQRAPLNPHTLIQQRRNIHSLG